MLTAVVPFLQQPEIRCRVCGDDVAILRCYDYPGLPKKDGTSYFFQSIYDMNHIVHVVMSTVWPILC